MVRQYIMWIIVTFEVLSVCGTVCYTKIGLINLRSKLSMFLPFQKNPHAIFTWENPLP